jgi:hypothetical protein
VGQFHYVSEQRRQRLDLLGYRVGKWDRLATGS